MTKEFKTFSDFVYHDEDFEEGDFPVIITEEELHSDIVAVLAMSENEGDLNAVRVAFYENDSDFEKFAKKVLLLDSCTSGNLRYVLEHAPKLEYGDYAEAKEKAFEYLEGEGLPKKLQFFIDIELVIKELESGGDWIEIEGTYIFNANTF